MGKGYAHFSLLSLPFGIRWPEFEVKVVDFGKLPIKEQVLTTMSTDILIMVHGGAYGNVIFLPHHAVVVDFYPYSGMFLWCAQQFFFLSTVAVMVLPNSMLYQKQTRKDPSHVHLNTQWVCCIEQGHLVKNIIVSISVSISGFFFA